MDDARHVLVALNADNMRDESLLKKVQSYRARRDVSLSVAYVVPKITFGQSLSLPLAVEEGFSTLLSYTEEEKQEGEDALNKFGQEFFVPDIQQHLLIGSLSKSVNKLADEIGANMVIGSKTTLFETFQKTTFCKAVNKYGQYLNTIFTGYKLKFKTQ